jgi:hypothetical protein
MAKNHQQLAEQILPLVGGKENIRGVRHCQTRLRFTLVDGFLQGASGCWVFVKQFSRNDTATACQDWLRVPG